MAVKLSIIIPCYQSEATLPETLASVLAQDFESWEALIVNDGSPDGVAAIASEWVAKDARFRYFEKPNGGLGSARNFGLERALGHYILPLDSDNKVRPNFARKALKILEQDSAIGVVYGDAEYFGEKTGIWKVGEFSRYKMLSHNYIDACAIIRKQIFDELGLYDEAMPHQGHEDWDFWLRVIAANHSFFYLEEVTFDYRVLASSMIRSFDKEMTLRNIDYIFKKHYKLYGTSFVELKKKHDRLVKEFNIPIFTKIKRKLIKGLRNKGSN